MQVSSHPAGHKRRIGMWREKLLLSGTQAVFFIYNLRERCTLIVLHPGWPPADRKVCWRKVRTPQGSAPRDERGQRRRKPPLTESVTENIPPEADRGFEIRAHRIAKLRSASGKGEMAG